MAMEGLCERIKCARDVVRGLAVKYPMPTIVPFDCAGAIREQCEFLKALVSCCKTAEEEYCFVKSELNGLGEIRGEIARLRDRIPSVRMPLVDGEEDIADQTEKGIEETRSQLYDFAGLLDGSVTKINEKVDKLGEDLKSFKVVLFGRTKAGKSTVREALTQGSGETIGKGRQSTTKEVQWYEWQNLKVYDTPGILSTNDTNRGPSGIGDEESKALELLQEADVAIFMFASDNIETAELDYLNDVVRRGKNVLVLLNVKADLTDYKAFLLRRKDKSVTLDKQSGHVTRIREAVKGHNVTIIPVHAQAAFFSRARNNSAVASFFERYFDDGATKTSLYDLSRFGEIRRYLADNILTKGRVIRCQQIR
ncbi:MAG: GTPase domain-containing protein, partial [bacterium]|nr:GTPase domain-containing protein [bacterium]